MKGRTANAGFSLLEVLVALGIVTVGVTAVLALFAAGVDTHKHAVDQSNASLAAQFLASELESKYTVAAVDAWVRKESRKGRRVEASDYLKDVPLDKPVEIPGFPDYRYAVTYIPLDSEGYAVLAEIRIFWRKGGGRAIVEPIPMVLLKRPY